MSDTVGVTLVCVVMFLFTIFIGNGIYNKIDAINKKRLKKFSKSEWYNKDGEGE